MVLDVQNIYISNYYIRNSLLFLIIILVLLSYKLMIEQKRKNIIIERLNDYNNYNFAALYFCTILPANFISMNEAKESKFLEKLLILNNYSFIISLSLVCGFLLYIYLFKNKYTILNAVRKPFILGLYIFTLLEAISSQISFLKWYNIIVIIILVVLSSNISNMVIIKEHKKESIIQKSISFNFEPIQLNSELYEERIWQKNKLINIIENNMGIKTICVSAEWGQGKTSFINIVESELRDKNYPIIRINALDFSSLNTLFNYYFEELEIIIKKYGYYKGLSSEFSNFTRTLANIILEYNKIKFTVNKTNDYSYIVEKQNLQRVLNEALGDKKIIVIVDDVERCDSELSLQYIKFIKEIAAFDKCIILFLSDYEELLKLPNVNEKYIQKFINYRFDLRLTNYREILTYIYKSFPEMYNFISNINIDITNEIDKILYKQTDEIDKLKIKRNDVKNEINTYNTLSNKINKLVSKHEEFVSILSNPRTINKLCESIIDKKNTINQYVNQNLKDEQFLVFLNNINISRSVVCVSLIQTLFPIEYEKIKKISLMNYVKNLQETKEQLEKGYQKSVNIEEEIIIDICNDIWFNDYLFTTVTNYLQIIAVEFMNKLISEPELLGDLITPFTSKEDELISYINTNQWDMIDRTYTDLVDIVLKKHIYIKPLEGSKVLKKVFEHYMEVEQQKVDNINKCFNIFYYCSDMFKWIYPEMSSLKTFYCVINDNNYRLTDNKRYVQIISRFSHSYTGNSLSIINRALQYNILKFKINIFGYDNLLSKVLNQNTYETMIEKYVYLLTGKKENTVLGNIKLLTCMVTETDEYIRGLNYMYDDVIQDINKAKMLLDEFVYLDKINNYVIKESEENKLDVIETDNLKTSIERYILYLNKGSEFNIDEEFKNMNDFSIMLFENKNLEKISAEIVDLYNELITIYLKKVNGNISNFRIKALEISERLKNNQNDKNK